MSEVGVFVFRVWCVGAIFYFVRMAVSVGRLTRCIVVSVIAVGSVFIATCLAFFARWSRGCKVIGRVLIRLRSVGGCY